MIALVALFIAAIAAIGVGAFLLGTRQTTEMVSGGAGVAGGTSPSTGVAPTPTEATTTVMPASTAPTIATPTTAGAPASPPTTAAPALSGTPAVTNLPPELVDNDATARADLALHFSNHDSGDLDAAYTGLTASFAPPFDDFVQFWSVDVASVDSPIDECDVTGDRGVCSVRFFITYSGEADEGVRNRCLGQSVELTMQRTEGRFLIDEQRNLGPLVCPTS